MVVAVSIERRSFKQPNNEQTTLESKQKKRVLGPRSCAMNKKQPRKHFLMYSCTMVIQTISLQSVNKLVVHHC